ncbi:MAG TPA: CPBP family intramembrane glutamic endopeptidase [Thermoanaerobaculia bacterium]|nr:CPBP family intramembrane glutamic endopeptidase [Thermoanaerobaculia bacterium]
MRNPGRAAWHGLASWGAVVLGSLLGAALIAPWVYAGLLAVEPRLPWPFGRVFNRLAMLVLLLVLVAVRRDLGWPRWRALLSAGRPGGRWAAVGAGFAVAMVGAVLGVAWALAAGELVPSGSDYPYLSRRTLFTLMGAFAASFIEEGFFRGLMFPALAASLGALNGALASSALFSLVHVFSADRSFVWEGFSAAAGFAYLTVVAGNHAHPAVLRPLFGLFLVGVALALLVWRTGSLYLAIGLHAGWALVFQLLRHAKWPAVHVPRGLPALAQRYFVLGQPWAWVVIGVTAALALAWGRRLKASAAWREAGADDG